MAGFFPGAPGRVSGVGVVMVLVRGLVVAGSELGRAPGVLRAPGRRGASGAEPVVQVRVAALEARVAAVAGLARGALAADEAAARALAALAGCAGTGPSALHPRDGGVPVVVLVEGCGVGHQVWRGCARRPRRFLAGIGLDGVAREGCRRGRFLLRIGGGSGSVQGMSGSCSRAVARCLAPGRGCAVLAVGAGVFGQLAGAVERLSRVRGAGLGVVTCSGAGCAPVTEQVTPPELFLSRSVNLSGALSGAVLLSYATAERSVRGWPWGAIAAVPVAVPVCVSEVATALLAFSSPRLGGATVDDCCRRGCSVSCFVVSCSAGSAPSFGCRDKYTTIGLFWLVQSVGPLP